MRSTARCLLTLAVLPAVLTIPHPASAFDYLEHSFFADRACRVAQDALAARIARGAADDTTVARFLGLAIVCPNTWDRPYCAGGYKQLEANINRLKAQPAKSHQLSLSLGDFAALPDHISDFGPVRGLPGAAAEQNGLLARVFAWISSSPRSIGGVIGDVSEDACETNLVPWPRVEADIDAFLAAQARLHDVPPVPAACYSPLARAPVPRGARDPATRYAFNNPHFLDLVLRDTEHFGVHAYTSWLGFHSTALEIAQRPCAEVVGLDADALEDLADGLPGLEDVDWDELPPEAMRAQGCLVLAERIRRRLLEWEARGDPVLTAPVAEQLEALHGDGPPAPAAAATLDRVVTAVMGLVFEGSGLHYLEDGLAAGHMRTIQSRRGLIERRFDHDLDNRNGVVALLDTATGEHPFVAFGDSYLLGPALEPSGACDWPVLAASSASPRRVSDCLIQHQRGVVTAAVASSLMDWSLSGFMYGTDGSEEAPCDRADHEAQFLCRNLPLQATHVPGQEVAGLTHKARLHHGVLPVPPPPFHYESLSISVATDIAGSGNQVGLDAAMYSELGVAADWLTSFRVGLHSDQLAATSGQFTGDFSFGFHWRWAARFLIDGEPFVFAGLRGVSPGRTFVMGLGPRIGITGLPEGWVKIPLELSLSYRMPITLFTSDHGFFGDSMGIEAHWIQISLGLAFM